MRLKILAKKNKLSFCLIDLNFIIVSLKQLLYNGFILVKGAVKLSRVYEAGEEITVALLRENSVFGVLSLITGHRSDRFYHAVAFTNVELLSIPIEQVEKALKDNPDLSMLMLQGLSSRILQTEMMIETLAHRDMGSRLVSFLLILCRDFGVPTTDGITIDLRLSHQEIAEAIGSTRAVSYTHLTLPTNREV